MKTIRHILYFFALFSLTSVSAQVFLDEDFEGPYNPLTGIPFGWSKTGLSDDGIYYIGTSATANQGSYFPIPDHTTFIYTDDDYCNCDKSADRLIFPVLDLASVPDTQVVLLDFATYFPNLYGEVVSVQYRTDLENFWINLTDLNDGPNWQNYSIDISFLKGESTVYLSFLYNDLGNFAQGVAFDDVTVYLQPPHNFQLLSASIGEYSILPFHHIGEGIPVSVQVKNAGSQFSASDDITVAIYHQSNLITPFFQQAYTIENLNANEVRDEFLTFINPEELGAIIVVVRKADYDPSSLFDEVQAVITITEDYKARDRSSIAVLMGPPPNSTINLGSIYELPYTTTIDSVTFFIAPSASGIAMRVTVLQANESSVQGTLLGRSATYTSTAQDNTGNTLTLKIRDLNGEDLVLNEGFYYIGIEKFVASHGNYALGMDVEIFTPLRTFASLDGSVFFDFELANPMSYPLVPIIRPTFACALSASKTVSSNCIGGLLTLGLELENSVGAVSYAWSEDGLETDEITVGEIGQYTVTVRDEVGCELSEVFEVDELPAIFSIETFITHIDCFGAATGTIETQASAEDAEFIYVLNDVIYTDSLIENLSAGTYFLEVINTVGCSQFDTLVIEQGEELFVLDSIQHENFDNEDGKITLEIVGGTPPYVIDWLHGEQGAEIDSLSAGTYTAVITDDLSCSITREFEVEKILSIATLLFTDLRIYPNPSGGQIHLEISDLHASFIETEVRDTEGRIVYQSKETVSDSYYKHTYELSELAAGVYTIHLHTDQGSTSRVIKIK